MFNQQKYHIHRLLNMFSTFKIDTRKHFSFTNLNKQISNTALRFNLKKLLNNQLFTAVTKVLTPLCDATSVISMLLFYTQELSVF